MEMHQIHYFLKAAQVRNVTRAAAELHVSQPSLSRQIKLLEEELGVLLFERLPQGLQLTTAGEALQAHLSEIVLRLEQTPRLMEPFAEGLKGRVVIGCVPSVAARFLPEALTEFLRRFPGVQTSLQVLPGAEEIFREVHAGTLDLGLCAGDDPALEQVFLYGEALVAAVPAALVAAGAEVVSMADLAQLPFIATPPSCTVRRQLEGVAPGRLRRALEVQHLDAALSFAARGVGATVVPSGMASADETTLRFLPLDPPLSHRIYAYWRPGGALRREHPLVRLLAEHGARS